VSPVLGKIPSPERSRLVSEWSVSFPHKPKSLTQGPSSVIYRAEFLDWQGVILAQAAPNGDGFRPELSYQGRTDTAGNLSVQEDRSVPKSPMSVNNDFGKRWCIVFVALFGKREESIAPTTITRTNPALRRALAKALPGCRQRKWQPIGQKNPIRQTNLQTAVPGGRFFPRTR